ncbi:hypothetical protein FB382_004378 [Nocardioides ginsengisegetis]|uniref:Uncharacterized protein n=1 Tax=Nocardioides ginsengisegetis TaxID=661491 RepID=A0A7W3J491_9ACTN|nr:hypothetical protein [Nocardioides ginsengisegetis]MBA8806027.1 hypothetical protein [Nocardioides ginsengisegetis]
MSDPTPTEQAEAIEAMVRHAMAEHAALPDRGFDSARDRFRLRCQIDDLLDDHAELLEIVALEAQVAS